MVGNNKQVFMILFLSRESDTNASTSRDTTQTIIFILYIYPSNLLITTETDNPPLMSQMSIYVLDKIVLILSFLSLCIHLWRNSRLFFYKLLVFCIDRFTQTFLGIDLKFYEFPSNFIPGRAWKKNLSGFQIFSCGTFVSDHWVFLYRVSLSFYIITKP